MITPPFTDEKYKVIEELEYEDIREYLTELGWPEEDIETCIKNTKRLDKQPIAFCGAQRTPMRFRADAMQSISDAPKRLVLLFSPSAGSLLCSALLPA